MTDESKLHVKPTQEELEANAMKALEEAEALKAEGKDKNPVHPEPGEDPDPTPDPKDDQDPKDPDPKADPDPKDPDEDDAIKKELAEKDKKLKASAREAQILYHRNKQVNEAIEKASELPAPTEDQLKAEYGAEDWDLMSDFEKKIATESLTNKLRMDEITKVNRTFKDLEEWEKRVDTFIDDPANIANNPALDGVEDDFKLFATKPTRRGVDFDILVSSFLYQYEATPARPKKTQMFPQGNGGDSQKPKPKDDKISVEQGRILRETNYPKFKELLKAGKIRTEEF